MIIVNGLSNQLNTDYGTLMEKVKAITILQSTVSIMDWDMETKMPPKGVTLRGEQLALLSRLEHSMVVDRNIGRLVKKIESHPDYSNLETARRRNVYLIKKVHDEQTKLPEKLVTETTRQRIITIDTWKKAKATENFALFKPELEKLVNLKKRAAEILMEVKKTPTPYDALIDIYEPKLTSERIAEIFDRLREGLMAIIAKCQQAVKQPDTTVLQCRVPITTQRTIANRLARFLEYDTESDRANGRIDETEHPFTTGYYDDVRITTHYYEDNFPSSVFSVLHEGGHAIYEQNLNPVWMYQPIGAACSFGFHESQSRFVENIVGKSHEFWTYFLPKFKGLTGTIFSDMDLDAFVFAINQVRPSKIRILSDEVTYCLHIIIRFEIERDLMGGKITVAELPEVWNQKYKQYLNVDIENDSEGVMQDTHWASGYQGYFPCYALGNIYSGQILTRLRKDLPDWKHQIALGCFNNVKRWLINNIYCYGNLFDLEELLKKVTGEGINVEHYLRYLDTKYAQLYEF